MKTSPRLKTVFLAAASLAAASVAAAHAAAAPASAPAAIEHAVGTAEKDSELAAPVITARKVGVAAAAAIALAGLARLIGFRRIKAAAAAAAATAGRSASMAIRATGAAAGAAMRAASSPLRFTLMVAGLTLVAFAGIGFYDVEWAAGLVFGAFFAASVILGARRARRSLANGRPTSVR